MLASEQNRVLGIQSIVIHPHPSGLTFVEFTKPAKSRAKGITNSSFLQNETDF